MPSPYTKDVPRTCEWCDIGFLANRRQVNKGGGRWCSPRCRELSKEGKNHPNFKFGKYKHTNGYVVVSAKKHPTSDAKGRIYEHRYVVERIRGKALPKRAQVHHVNGDPTDNRPSNLVVCPDNKYHGLLHARQRVRDLGGDPRRQKFCFMCRKLVDKSNFHVNRRYGDELHNACKPCTCAKVRSYRQRTRKNSGGAL